jgi:hypothetical protein
MQKLSSALGLAEFGLQCANNVYNMWDGGNQWSEYGAFISFFRHVAKLALDYSKWDHYEKLTEHSGHRIMHEQFCMISDRPRILKVDARNRPHCETGPFCEWRDGSALYSLNGVRVPAWLVETPKEQLKAKDILALTNAQERVEGIKKIGIGNMLKELKAEVIDKMDDYQLISIEFENNRIGPYLTMVNRSTGEIHCEGVGTPNGGVDTTIKTCEEALAWRNEMTEYVSPEVLT